MSYRALFLTVGALSVLAACDTITEDQCQAGDWRAIGFADGAAGRAPDMINTHARTCANVGVTPNVAAWNAGREEGLRQYCTPQNAYRIGANGTTLAPYCPAGQREALNRANRTGIQYYEIGIEISELTEKSRELNSQINSIPASAPQDQQLYKFELSRERSRAEDRLRDLRRQRVQYEAL